MERGCHSTSNCRIKVFHCVFLQCGCLQQCIIRVQSQCDCHPPPPPVTSQLKLYHALISPRITTVFLYLSRGITMAGMPVFNSTFGLKCRSLCQKFVTGSVSQEPLTWFGGAGDGALSSGPAGCP